MKRGNNACVVHKSCTCVAVAVAVAVAVVCIMLVPAVVLIPGP